MASTLPGVLAGAQLRWRAPVVLGALVLLMALALLHVPWVNGPPYVARDYRQLTPWIYLRMALALGPFLLAQWLSWSRGRTRTGLLLLMLATFILQLASVGSQEPRSASCASCASSGSPS